MSAKTDESEILIVMDDDIIHEAEGPTYEQLAEAWWAINKALDVANHPWKLQWQNRVFCDLLQQCGWTIEAWNDEVEWRKLIPIDVDESGGKPPEK